MKKIKTYHQLKNYLGMKTLSDHAEKHFDDFLRAPSFKAINLEELMHLLTLIGVNNEIKKAFESSYDTITSSPLCLEALHYILKVSVIDAHPSEWLVQNAPIISDNAIEDGMFALTSILMMAHYKKHDFTKRNIDDQHLMFNLSHLKGYIENHHKKHGTLGIDNYTWCIYLGSLGLLRLHTLNFMHHIFTENFFVFRHKETKEIVVLAGSNLEIRTDGQLNHTNHVSDLWFKTEFKETSTEYEGYYVLPEGAVSDRYLTLNKELYQCILKPGDYVIDYHIPTGIPYDLENMKKSILEAKHFFKKHYPEFDYQAVWCLSWLSSPQIPFFIKNKEKNIYQVHQTGYTLPATNDIKSLYQFVFKKTDINLETIKPKTSLESGIIEHVTKGGVINCGVYLFFFDDLHHFETFPYVKEDNEKIFLNLKHYRGEDN